MRQGRYGGQTLIVRAGAEACSRPAANATGEMSDDDQDRYGRGAGPHRPVAGPGGARDLTAGIPAGHRNETGRTGGDYRRVLRPDAELCRTRRRGAPGCLGARRAGAAARERVRDHGPELARVAAGLLRRVGRPRGSHRDQPAVHLGRGRDATGRRRSPLCPDGAGVPAGSQCRGRTRRSRATRRPGTDHRARARAR